MITFNKLTDFAECSSAEMEVSLRKIAEECVALLLKETAALNEIILEADYESDEQVFRDIFGGVVQYVTAEELRHEIYEEDYWIVDAVSYFEEHCIYLILRVDNPLGGDLYLITEDEIGRDPEMMEVCRQETITY